MGQGDGMWIIGLVEKMSGACVVKRLLTKEYQTRGENTMTRQFSIDGGTHE